MGRGFEPDFLYTFPNARTGVMGGSRQPEPCPWSPAAKATATGQEPDETTLAQQEVYLANIFDSQSSAFYTSGHLMDDGMIDPRDSRKTLGFLLETVGKAGTARCGPIVSVSPVCKFAVAGAR